MQNQVVQQTVLSVGHNSKTPDLQHRLFCNLHLDLTILCFLTLVNSIRCGESSLFKNKLMWLVLYCIFPREKLNMCFLIF